MNKFVSLIDYLGNSSIVKVEDIENIETMCLLMLSGDECLVVKYKDDRLVILDSSDTRGMSLFDGIKFVTFDDLIVVEQDE